MPVLVDSSVWMSHYKQPNRHLFKLWQIDEVLCHPMVIGEVACGTPPKPRAKSLSMLKELPKSVCATMDDVIRTIERDFLYGAGCGFIDLSLLVSTIITPGAKLWTFDKRLSTLAEKAGVNYSPKE